MYDLLLLIRLEFWAATTDTSLLTSCIQTANTSPLGSCRNRRCSYGLSQRPPEACYSELDARYRAVRRFLPPLLQHTRFGASPAGEPDAAGFEWLRSHEEHVTSEPQATRAVITKPRQRHVLCEGDSIDFRAYTFCVLDGLRKAPRLRDVFVTPS
jgi:hypothetical protein